MVGDYTPHVTNEAYKGTDPFMDPWLPLAETPIDPLLRASIIADGMAAFWRNLLDVGKSRGMVMSVSPAERKADPDKYLVHAAGEVQTTNPRSGYRRKARGLSDPATGHEVLWKGTFVFTPPAHEVYSLRELTANPSLSKDHPPSVFVELERGTASVATPDPVQQTGMRIVSAHFAGGEMMPTGTVVEQYKPSEGQYPHKVEGVEEETVLRLLSAVKRATESTPRFFV